MHSSIWLTGLSGSGKSTLANEMRQRIGNLVNLDGDVLRAGLNKDLGFRKEDRIENCRRAVELNKILLSQGFRVINSFIMPFEEMREFARREIGAPYYEIYVKCSARRCAERDVKGLYKAMTPGLTTFEEPKNPDLIVDTEHNLLAECIEEVFNVL